MYEYKCFTRQGHWRFYADSDRDALRLALFYCWRDGEDFIKVVAAHHGKNYTLRLCIIDNDNNITTL